MRRAEPGSSQKLESRIPGNSYVRFGGERSEKGWPRYHQKELLAGRSNNQSLAGPLPYFLQVTDLFFRPLFVFVIIELKCRRDPRRRDTVSHRSLGCSTASGSHPVW